jgi:hypothetical protein
VPATAGTVSGAGHAVGGDLAQNNDHTANLADRMPLVIDFVLLPAFLIMAGHVPLGRDGRRSRGRAESSVTLRRRYPLLMITQPGNYLLWYCQRGD